MANLLEVLMVVCFGVSWPINILKAWRARTAKGSSLPFYCLILVGYLFGIGSKFVLRAGGVATPAYIWFFYILNAAMVTLGILVYFRNARLDRARGAGA